MTPARNPNANPNLPEARGHPPARLEPSGEQRREPPARPTLGGKESAPVLVTLRPPFVVAASQFLWVLSLLTGVVAVVYAFIIRQAQLPDIANLVRGVDETRVDDTYTLAADIIFWSVFGILIAVLLLQVWLLVSFANRRPNVRWGQFTTIVFQAGIVLVTRELIAFGDRGAPMSATLLAQFGLALLGLLIGLLPPALRWTARKHDVRRGPEPASGGSGL